MIGIIDYGAGNLKSLTNALERIGQKSFVCGRPEDLKRAQALVLPGVGSFGYAMGQLERLGMSSAIIEWIDEDKKFLGICLGMQVLFESSEESPGVRGLGILKGNVVRFREGKVPQIGWNRIVPCQDGIFREAYMYFVNSYYVVPSEDVRSARTEYGVEFTSAVQKDNITAVQFHPEKSAEAGEQLLRRWSEC